MRKHLDMPCPRITCDLPCHRVGEVIETMMAKDREDRYSRWGPHPGSGRLLEEIRPTGAERSRSDLLTQLAKTASRSPPSPRSPAEPEPSPPQCARLVHRARHPGGASVLLEHYPVHCPLADPAAAGSMAYRSGAECAKSAALRILCTSRAIRTPACTGNLK